MGKKVTKAGIKRIEAAHRKAEKALSKLMEAEANLGMIITYETGVPGLINQLSGDGFGYQVNNRDTHIGVSDLIQLAKTAEIDFDVIDRNSTL